MKNDPKALSPEQLSAALDKLAELELIGEAIKAHAVAQVHAGVEVPGYVKAWTTARRIWALTEDKVVARLKKLGVPDPYERSLLSPAKAEKALRSVGKWPKKQRGEERPPSPLEPFLDYTEQNPTIAKAGR